MNNNMPMPQQVQGAFQPNMPMPQQVQGAYQPIGDDIKTLCQQYMNYHVIGQMRDGSQVDGIITGMDENSVTMLVPEEVGADEVTRQFGFGYEFDYDNDYEYDYEYDFDYGRPRRRRFRRFRRRRFPFRFFRRLFRYPYYYTYYPWYGYGGEY